MRTHLSTALVMISVCSVSFGQSFEFAGEHPFKLGDDQGKVEITLDNTILRKGDGCPVHVKFTNTNGSYSVYNWQFVSLIPLPGQLAIYDSNRGYLGDLIAFEMGSRKSPGLTDWTFLYTGSSVASWVGFRAGRVPNHIAGGSLPAGTYYVQLILYNAFVSYHPYFTGTGEALVKTFDRSELCRSNVVKIQIVEK